MLEVGTNAPDFRHEAHLFARWPSVWLFGEEGLNTSLSNLLWYKKIVVNMKN